MRPESYGSVKFGNYLKGLDNLDDLPPVVLIAEATGLRRSQIQGYIKKYRAKGRLPAVTDESFRRRLSTAKTFDRGDLWPKIMPYAQSLRMSRVETAHAWVIDGITEEGEYTSQDMGRLYTTARKNGLEPFSDEESIHVQSTTKRVDSAKMHDRVFAWLNIAHVLSDESYWPTDRLEWFDLLDHVSRNKFRLGKEANLEFKTKRAVDFNPRFLFGFKSLIQSWLGIKDSKGDERPFFTGSRYSIPPRCESEIDPNDLNRVENWGNIDLLLGTLRSQIQKVTAGGHIEYELASIQKLQLVTPDFPISLFDVINITGEACDLILQKRTDVDLTWRDYFRHFLIVLILLKNGHKLPGSLEGDDRKVYLDNLYLFVKQDHELVKKLAQIEGSYLKRLIRSVRVG